MLEISIGALVLGLAGSLHCAGMCGPIALALPLGDRRWAGKTFGSLLYNLGRALTYAVMGLAFGLLGQGMALAGLQQGVSIFAGAFMLLWVLVPWVQTKTQRTEATIQVSLPCARKATISPALTRSAGIFSAATA